MTNTTTQQDNIKTLSTLYALVGAGSIMMVIPYMLLPYAGVACAFVGLMSAYFYRWRGRGDAIMVYHTTYIIHTVWISSIILTVGIILFGCIIFFNGDMSVINMMMADVEKGIVPSESDINSMQHIFVETNKGLILTAAVISLLPYPLYLIFRTFKGVTKLTKKG